ncbi:enoyl-CoA hydratase-related protein [Geodermatophilus sp. URMC 60]|jgi:methylglutaconyl-CoA hydratase
MSDRVLQVERRRGVATLTLDSAANRNALPRAVRAQLRSAPTEAITDDPVRVVVLDRTGRAFCSGMDLAGTERLLRAVRTGPLAEEFPELLTSSARFFAGEEGQEGITASREKRPAPWVPA